MLICRVKEFIVIGLFWWVVGTQARTFEFEPVIFVCVTGRLVRAP